MACPIARGLERVGEWWSMLILRDAFAGIARFEDFQQSLGIAPGMLTRRLSALVESGLLERRRYSERPPRDEYLLTARGRDFAPVLVAMLAWGNRHFAPEGATMADRRQPDRRARPTRCWSTAPPAGRSRRPTSCWPPGRPRPKAPAAGSRAAAGCSAAPPPREPHHDRDRPPRHAAHRRHPAGATAAPA